MYFIPIDAAADTRINYQESVSCVAQYLRIAIHTAPRAVIRGNPAMCDHLHLFANFHFKSLKAAFACHDASARDFAGAF